MPTRYRSLFVAVCLVAGFALFMPASGSASTTWNVLSNPISASQLTDMPWGENSYWLQPWRSSLVTRPATALQTAIGINFDVPPQDAMDTARLLAASGVRRARLEISWNDMEYGDPTQLENSSQWAEYITALRHYGIRPLILVNGDPEGPTPDEPVTLDLTAPAAAGARTVSLSSASAAHVVPGLTGFSYDGDVARVLITSVSVLDIATLSQPLYTSLPAGPVAATTLEYEPFAPPDLITGAANPRFQQTLAGWLSYVKSVCQFVAGVYGSDNFDVEVWNEDQTFLNEGNYFNPVPDPGSNGSTTYAVLQSTVQMLHDPANGLTGVQVGDGFSNQVPWTSGTTVPPGTAAIDRHPYVQTVNVYPGSGSAEAGVQPVNLLGLPVKAADGVVQPTFTPTFRAFFPEYYLTGIQTETLMRDLSSTIVSNVDGVIHGATTHPSGGAAPAMWITEDELDQNVALANGLPASDLQEFQAKAALRFYLSYASEGAQAIDLFAADGGSCCQIIPTAFFSALASNPSSYPGNLGGLTMQALGRMTSQLSGARPIAQPRHLSLTSIAQYGENSQFTGNGTAGYPDLYDRDVLAFFPFQVNANTFLAGVYVMTRDLTHWYTSTPLPGQSDYDLPPESFQLTIGGVNAANAAVSLYDPMTGLQQPAAIISRAGTQIVVQLSATDSPRMLEIYDGSPAAAPKGPSGLTLSVPAKLPAATALKHGVKLLVGCVPACTAKITALPRHGSRVYGRATGHPTTARSVVKVTLKLSRKGRKWLGSRKVTRLRITARNKAGTKVSKVIKITHGRARKAR